jgi:hypothetical protein
MLVAVPIDLLILLRCEENYVRELVDIFPTCEHFPPIFLEHLICIVPGSILILELDVECLTIDFDLELNSLPWIKIHSFEGLLCGLPNTIVLHIDQLIPIPVREEDKATFIENFTTVTSMLSLQLDVMNKIFNHFDDTLEILQ